MASASDPDSAMSVLKITRRGIVSVVVKNWRKQATLFLGEIDLYNNAISICKVDPKRPGGGVRIPYCSGVLLAADAYTEPPVVDFGISIVLSIRGEQVVETLSLTECDQLEWLRTLNAGLRTFHVSKLQLDPAQLKIGRLLGMGAFGDVFFATVAAQQSAGGGDDSMSVAIKVLRPADQSVTVDFANEAGILAALDHPNVLRFLGICVLDQRKDSSMGIEDGGGGSACSTSGLALVVEYCPSGTLKELLHEVGRGGYVLGPTLQPLSMEKRLDLLHGVVKGCAYIHSQAIVHRDLKPENIMIGEAGVPKLVDFGQSRTVELNRTMTANTRGSLLWRAPEIMSSCDSGKISRSSMYDTAADVYSLGIIIWETLSLQEPFVDVSNTWDIVDGVCSGELRPSMDPDWPEALVVLMKRSWLNDPAGRPGADRIAVALADHANLLKHEDATKLVLQLLESDEAHADERATIDKSSPILDAITERAKRRVSGPSLKNDLPTLVTSLLRSPEEGGLALTTNRWFLFKFHKCFVGRDLVAWVQDRCRCDESAAVAVGENLQRLGFITHSIKGTKFGASCFFFWQDQQVIRRLLIIEDRKMSGK